MTNTLEALKSGKLVGSKSLKLACGLTAFPEAVITLAETLEVLDLSDNKISVLPDSISKLKKLRIIFFARNKFTEFPAVLGQCPELRMIGFKSNQIHNVPENAFPPKMHWLILTDNKIKKLPKSIGDAPYLRKCALAGNLLETLPSEMANCKALELLRISANNLELIPDWLFNLPKLSWLAFGGNPGVQQIQSNTQIATLAWEDFKVEHLIGEGASGFISKAKWHTKNKDVAIKIFKGALTSDGLPEDEMGLSIAAGYHDNLIQILGKIDNHPEDKIALIMQLIDTSYTNLGNPPSLETCTRDIIDKTMEFTEAQFLKIAKSMASVCAHLHKKGINHGDFYAHNILINQNAHTILGDFGAASFYDVNLPIAQNIERIEVRAFGCLIEDLLDLVCRNDKHNDTLNIWTKLIQDCTIPEVRLRPSFLEISERLAEF